VGHPFATLPLTNMIKIKKHTTAFSQALPPRLLDGAAVASLGAGSAQAALNPSTQASPRNTFAKLRNLLMPSMIALFAVFPSGPAQAAGISITPAGDQLDQDPILDVKLKPGQQITFDVFFDNSLDNLSTTRLEYDFTYDANELSFVQSNLNISNKFDSSGSLPTAGNLFVFHLFPSGDPGLAPQANFLLDQLVFVGNNVERSPGNGILDAKIINGNNVNSPLLGPDVTISTFSSNELEVQYVPGPLPLLGIGVAFGYGRKLRKHIKSVK